MLLNKDFRVIHTSDFTYQGHLDTLEFNGDTLLYSIQSDGGDYCLALVRNDNLQLLNKHTLSQ